MSCLLLFSGCFRRFFSRYRKFWRKLYYDATEVLIVLAFALILFIFLKVKKVKFGPIPQQKNKILAAVFETAGQFTYVYTLGGVDAVAEPILSSVCIVSLLLSRIFLKEKLSWKTYVFITVVIIGILLLAVSEEL